MSYIDYTEAELDRIFYLTTTRGIGGAYFDFENRIVVRADYGKASLGGWQVDHVIPVALGGFNTWGNLRARSSFGNARAGGILGALVNRRLGAL